LLEKSLQETKSELILSEQTPNYIGGCKVQTQDGKIVYDATLDNRLQELKPELRAKSQKASLERHHKDDS
jgi:vacuolar-type H+-ATPase subunit E/Vma4